MGKIIKDLEKKTDTLPKKIKYHINGLKDAISKFEIKLPGFIQKGDWVT